MSLEKLVISRAMEKDCICDVFTGCARVKEIAFADGETYSLPNVVEAAADSFFSASSYEIGGTRYRFAHDGTRI